MKRLTKEQKIELQREIVEGKTDSELSNLYQVSISNIQYHKSQLRKKGQLVKKKRGRVAKASKANSKNQIRKLTQTERPVLSGGDFKIRINGVNISIKDDVKDIKIDRNGVSVIL